MGYAGGKRVRRSFYGKTRRDVLHKLDLARREWADSGGVVPGRQTVASYLRRWLIVTGPALRPRTAQNYRRIIERSIIPSFGKRRLDRLRRPEIQGWIGDLTDAGKAPRTIKNHHAVLRRALNEAMRQGELPHNPALLATLPRIPQTEIAPLTVEQTAAFLDHVEGHRLEALYWIAAALGLRQGEILGLRWEDIDLDGHALMVRKQLQRLRGRSYLVEPKTSASRRVVPLPAPIAARLRVRRQAQREEQLAAGIAWAGNPFGLVFTREDGSPIVAETLTEHYQALLQEAELPRKRFHDLRHGAATFMIAHERWPIEVVQIALGHSTPAITSAIYVHAGRNQIAEAVEGVTRLLERNRVGVSVGVNRTGGRP